MIYRTRATWGSFAAVGGGLSVLYWQADASPSTEEAQAAVTKHGALFQDLRAVVTVSDGYNVQGLVELVDEVTGETEAEYSTVGIAANGLASGEILPRQVQGLISWRTSTFRDGRRVRGRTYIPGAAEVDNASGSPTSSYRGLVAAAAAEHVAAQSSPPAQVIWSRPRDAGEPGGARPGLAALVTGYTVPTTWATLRSRNR